MTATRGLKITGGLVIGTGGATSSPTANVSTVYSLITGGGNANQIIHIEDAEGNEVLLFKSNHLFHPVVRQLKADSKYNVQHIYRWRCIIRVRTAWLVYVGTYTGGSITASFTTNNKVTQIGGSISRF